MASGVLAAAVLQPSAHPLACSLVNNLTRKAEQCNFIIENDCRQENALDYVYLVYCVMGTDFRFGSILALVFLVVILFLALSSIADEFLCPSLLTIAKNLRMSDSLAGVTLLAFGNGCPDIFSSIAAAADDRPELIVSELLGSGIFCASIVAGLIFIRYQFKLACRPVLRDAIFYLSALYLTWTFCWVGQIRYYDALAFILIYVIYLVVALGGQALHSRLRGNYDPQAKSRKEACCSGSRGSSFKSQPETETDGDPKKPQLDSQLAEIDLHDSNDNWFERRESSLNLRRKLQEQAKIERKSLMLDGKSHLSYKTNDCVTVIHLGLEPFKGQPKSSGQTKSRLQESKKSKSLDDQPSGTLNKAYEPTELAGYPFSFNDQIKPEDTVKGQQTIVKQSNLPTAAIHEEPQNAGLCDGLSFEDWDSLLSHINPFEGWTEAHLLRKFLMILGAPLYLLALLTVPVVDYSRPNGNWCRLLNSMQCLLVPLMVVMSNKIIDRDREVAFGLTTPLVALLFGLPLAIVVLRTSNSQSPPKYHTMFAYLGFLESILWICMLVTEILGLLETIGIIFSMSDEAIGLGFLAWGNSLGDIVANLSLAEAGYPRMAIGASIGAPLLNLLLGLGLSFSLSLSPGESSSIEYSSTISLLCITMAVLLLSMMACTLLPADKSRKWVGFTLIGIYAIYFVLACFIELDLLDFGAS